MFMGRTTHDSIRSMHLTGLQHQIVHPQGGACRPTEVAEGIGPGQNGLAYNGINLSPDKRRLLVADTKVRLYLCVRFLCVCVYTTKLAG